MASNKYPTVYDSPDYPELKQFNDRLLDEKSRLGKIISSATIKQSSENIQRAIVRNLIVHGHAVWIGSPDRNPTNN